MNNLKNLNQLKYLIVGGDERSAYLAHYLISENKNVKIIFGNKFENIVHKDNLSSNWENELQNSNVIIFPLPISKDNKTLNNASNEKIDLQTIIEKISITYNKENKIVLGGGITNPLRELFACQKIKIIDYLEKEELAILNAVVTAEAAVEIAMKNLPITIYNSNCLVTGFGRVSKALVNVLNALKANVTVAARKCQDLTWAQVYGCQTQNIENLNLAVKNQDIIFNTVPYQVINYDVLKNINQECLIIDLASKPGGVDFDKAKELGIKAELALALPGKFAPKTSGLIIKKTIINILNSLL